MSKRPFTLFDAILLVASAAIGSWLAGMWIVSDRIAIPGPKRDVWSARIGAAWLLNLGMNLGIATVRLRPPRPPIRRLSRQPGSLALFAVASNIALGTACGAWDWIAFRRGLKPFEIAFENWRRTSLLSISGPWNVGFAVALAWAIGGLQGFRWRQADWIEWAARAIGVSWILSWLILMALH